MIKWRRYGALIFTFIVRFAFSSMWVSQKNKQQKVEHFPGISKQSTQTVENRVNISGIHYVSPIRKLKTGKK